jgi:putative redox protein
VVEIMRKARQDVRGMAVRVDGEQAPDPPWPYRRLTLRFELSGRDLDVAGAERAARLSVERYCSVIASLRGVAEIDWHVTVTEDAGEQVA